MTRKGVVMMEPQAMVSYGTEELERDLCCKL